MQWLQIKIFRKIKTSFGGHQISLCTFCFIRINRNITLKLIPRDRYNHRGIYKLKCNVYSLEYIGQLERTFKVQFTYAHKNNNKQTKKNSKYAQQIIDTGHLYSTFDQTSEILRIQKKGKLFYTLGTLPHTQSKQTENLN
jgi:hypothetical protein